MSQPSVYWHRDSLAGSRAVVTGAGRGIGKGVAHALLERGASVFLVDRSESVADTAAEFAEAGLTHITSSPICVTAPVPAGSSTPP